MGDLDPAPFRTVGRAAKPLHAVQVRALEETDLLLLGEEKGSKAPAIKRLAERHHALARYLATGYSPSAAAHAAGYSPSRVSILQADPAFKELLEFYRADVNAQYIDTHGILGGMSRDAAMELWSRIEDDIQADEKSISIGQLIELTKLGADRTGFGPQSSSTNLNINVDLADRLKAARARVAARRIEHDA